MQAFTNHVVVPFILKILKGLKVCKNASLSKKSQWSQRIHHLCVTHSFLGQLRTNVSACYDKQLRWVRDVQC